MTVAVSPLEMPIVAAYVHEISGIVIEPTKGYLIEGRLGPMLASEGAGNYADLVRLARADASGRLRVRLVDALATSETSFFRDERPFDLLAHKLVPEVLERQPEAGLGFKPLDALHIACAETAGADVLLTTDDRLLRRAERQAGDLDVAVANPLRWLEEQIV